MIPSVGAALTPQTAAWLNGACDYICQTYIREQIISTKQPGEAGLVLQTPTGKKEYCLRVGPHQVYITGFRLPGNISLPDSLVDPTFDKINKLIKPLS